MSDRKQKKNEKVNEPGSPTPSKDNKKYKFGKLSKITNPLQAYGLALGQGADTID